jgi:putative lipoprotein
MHRMLYTLSKAFGMPKDELEHLKAQEKFKIPTLKKLLTNDELELKNGIQTIKTGIDSPFKYHRDQNRDD